MFDYWLQSVQQQFYQLLIIQAQLQEQQHPSVLNKQISYLNFQLNSIQISIQMDSVKKLQQFIFERAYIFQRGTMQSQLAFIISQIAKLIFKDLFVITLFIFPLQNVKDTVYSFFEMTKQLNLIITTLLAILLIAFIFIVVLKMEFLQEKIKYLMQLLMPWIDAFSLLIIAISFQLLITNMNKNIELVAFNIITIVLISFIQVLYTLFDFTKQPRSHNLYKKRESNIIIFTEIVTLLFSYYLSVTYFLQDQKLSSNQIIIYSIIHFGISVVKIKERVYYQFYLNPFSQSISSAIYFVELNLSLLSLVYFVLQLKVFLDNIIFLLIIMTILEYSALNSYILKRNSDMFLSSAADLKDQKQALLYLDRLCELITKVEKEQEDIILVSLKKKHSITCKIAQCSCRKGQFQLGIFIKQYVRCQLQQMTEMFHNSLSILISILYIKMVIFKYYPDILAKLNYYSSHFNLSLKQRYYHYCLAQYVSEFIRKKNYEIDAVQSQYMFKLEQIRSQVENIMQGEVQVRNKIWKYLSRGLCRVSQLQSNCNQSLKYISRLIQIYQQNKDRFKKSKEFNLLLLFYFTKVSFLNNGKQIKQNLKELYYGYKQDQLYSLKQFKKFIYHKRCCVIETLIDAKTMGIITAASRNIEEMFGFPTNKVVGISINNLMPQFMAEQHECIISDWAKSGTWRTIGKLKQIYCVHKDQYCFSALIYLKIYIKDNNMHFITSIFKLNQNDFLVINPNMRIQGVGRKFLKILGEPSKKINLNLIIQNKNQILNQQDYVEGKIYRKIFLSLKNLQSQVDQYLQNYNMKYNDSQKEQVSQQFHEKLIKICQEKYYLQFSIKKYQMGKIRFLVIGLKQAKKIQKYQTSNYLQKLPTYIQNQNQKDLIDFDAFDSQESSFEKQDENDRLIIQHNASSSLTSLSQKQNYPIAKTIQKFISYVQKPSTIQDSRLSNYNIIILAIVVTLCIINFISYYCYKQMLLQIQGIFFADGSQSDIMQTTQIGYNYIYVLKSQLQKANMSEFNSTLTSARLVNSYVYSLRQDSFESLITNVTQLSKERMFSYLEQPATWLLNNKKTEVLTHQFLQNMYYLSSRVINQLQKVKNQNISTINYTFFNQLFNNFPQMKRINEFYLVDYQNISNKQHVMLNLFTIISMVTYFVLSLILAICLNHYFKFRFNQLINSFTFFSFIPNYYLQKMKDYYSSLISNLIETQKLKNIDSNEDQIFEIDTYDLFHKNDLTKNSLSSKIKFINYQNYYKWIFIILLFCLINGINYLGTSQIRNFFPNSQQVIVEVNDLMRSENKLLEAYFDLRGSYSLKPDQYINQTLYDNILMFLNNSDTKFNSVANQLTTIFSDYDPNYQGNFVKTLVSSICGLAAPYLTKFQNQKCVKQLTLNMLDGGILISMNYFQRNVRTALQDLRMQYIVKNQSKYQGDYFRQFNFVQLDKMLIYMFKIYQQTQAVTYNSYINIIGVITNKYIEFTVGTTAFFLIVMIIWIKSIASQKLSLSYLYGHLLLIPFNILKSNSRILSSLKEAIQYTNN